MLDDSDSPHVHAELTWRNERLPLLFREYSIALFCDSRKQTVPSPMRNKTACL
jgi:hypothetical protein